MAYFLLPLLGPVSLCSRDDPLIAEQVIKKPDIAEAYRFCDFPFAAVEVALSNAGYHKGYEIGSPIEVQMWSDKILILSNPGLVPPVNGKVYEYAGASICKGISQQTHW